MLTDGRTIPHDTIISTDICIIGAGPAGITLTNKLHALGKNICLLESGGLEGDEAIQSLLQGEIVSSHNYPKDELEAGRYRQFGGAANRWHVELPTGQVGVRHAPLDEIDFVEREWFPNSGWPVTYQSLLPYYQEAQNICELGPFSYDAKCWQTPDALPLKICGDRLYSSVFQFGKREIFTKKYLSEYVAAPNVHLITYANLADLQLAQETSRLQGAKVVCWNKVQFTVKANLFVLAMGGIENARALLLSNAVQSSGLGNQNDLVGRFYMDHPGFSLGSFFPARPRLFERMRFYDLRMAKGQAIAGKLSLTPETMQQNQILNTSIWFFPRPYGHNALSVSSAKALLAAARGKKRVNNWFYHLKTALAGGDEILRVAYRSWLQKKALIVDAGKGGWSQYQRPSKLYSFFEVAAQVEQAPCFDNRVSLSQSIDELGLRRAKVNWAWSPLDIASIHRTLEILETDFSASELGQFMPLPSDRLLSKLYSAHHHMGTTRMHKNPQQGVVDSNCRVHGIDNLFVAGSSLFPTGGYANPTLTIVALALRLAEYLAKP